MGAIIKQLWISREYRKLVSHELQRRLVVISMVLGVSLFLIFLGGLMWALIAANRDPAVNLNALKFVSYAFFGTGALGSLAFCLLWLVYVRDAKFEIRQQELRQAPDLFRFPPPQEEPAMPADPGTQLTDLHSADSRPDLAEIASAAAAAEQQQQLGGSRRPGVVSPPGFRLASSSSTSGPETPGTASSFATSVAASERPQTLTAVGRRQQQRLHFFDQPPRPRAVSQSDSVAAVILEPSALAISRPSSVTTSSSKERFIV